MSHATRRHHPTKSTDRETLPRALVGRLGPFLEKWLFRTGQLVDWDGELWQVQGRNRTFAGREIYEVYRPGDDRPVRFIDGRMLSHPAQPVLLVA